MQLTDQPIEPPIANTTDTAESFATSVPSRMAPFAASRGGSGTVDYAAQKHTVNGEHGLLETYRNDAASPGSTTSDHDATPRGEHPPHYISTFTTSASPSPRKALQRYKTVKPSQSSELLSTSVLVQRRNKDKPSISKLEDGDLLVRDGENGSTEKGTSGILNGIMTSHTTERKESRNVDKIPLQDEDNADLKGRSSNTSSTQSKLKNVDSDENETTTQPQDYSAERREVFNQAPRSSVTSNGSASSDSTEHGPETTTTTTATTSPSSRPWLLSRSSSSTIDIPIQSTEPSSPQEAESAVEEEKPMVVSSDSYFPDVTALQRAGVMEPTQEVRSNRPSDTAEQIMSPRNMDMKKAHATSPVGERKSKNTVWPCSKKHGDTPIGMSVALSLTDALGFKLGNPNAQLKAGTPSKVTPTQSTGKDAGSGMMNPSDDHGALSPTSQPLSSTKQKNESDLRRQMSDSQASSMATDRFLSASAPVGKQASLSQHSAARSMEDSLLESWGFTVSTPLCPPKCYPLSSPALSSLPKERFCRTGSSSSVSSAEKDDARRRLSTSTPPASTTAPAHMSSFANTLNSRKSYTFGSEDNYKMQKQPDAPAPRSRLGSVTMQPRTSSPMREVTSDSPPSQRPSFLRDTSNGSNSGHSEAVSSRSNTPASSRHNSATGSDLYDNTRSWRRDSAMSAQSSDTTGTSRSSGVFSIDLAEHPGRRDDDGSGSLTGGYGEIPTTHPSDASSPSAVERQAAEASADDTSDPDAAHSDEPHVVPYEGIVNIIPYDDKYLISAIMEGFTLDNITVAVKSVRNGIEKPVADDNCSIKSCGSANSGKSITAGNQTRKTKCVHLVADRWDDGAHFERKIAFGTDADFSKGIKARFDGNELQIDIPRSLRGASLWDLDRFLEPALLPTNPQSLLRAEKQ
ncbi:hypothetical protein QFC24_005433 [Naganishia onofrii]|uniref:Uncharacterized protein n=1 Tax=Naganishia onofrii TaxID=1851511 RepID=A0ACC2X7C2_9TREE|nr:hypothetical protein QFC24_005433 [Naganishia onofrii]